jgi:hypothetical protein
MPRMVSVLDTNVYRSIGDDGLTELMALERGRSVIGGVSYQVAQELVAHLASRDDPDFGSAYAALLRLARHCKRYDGRPVLFFLADGLDQVARSIFGRQLSGEDVPESYAGLIGDIVDAKMPQDWPRFRLPLEEVRSLVQSNRETFVAAVRGIASDLAARWGLPGGTLDMVLADQARRRLLCRLLVSDDAIRGIAGMTYRQIATMAQVEIGDAPPDEAIDLILERFPTPLRLFATVMQKTLCENYNLERRNSVAYDTRISFLVGHRDPPPLAVVMSFVGLRPTVGCSPFGSHRLWRW